MARILHDCSFGAVIGCWRTRSTRVEQIMWISLWLFLTVGLSMADGSARERGPSSERLVLSYRGGLGYGDRAGIKLALQPGAALWFGGDPSVSRVGVGVEYTRALAFWNYNWSATTASVNLQSRVRENMRLDLSLGGGAAHLWDTETCWDCPVPTIADASLQGVWMGAVGWQGMAPDSPEAVHLGAQARLSVLRTLEARDNRTVAVMSVGICAGF